MKTESCGDSRLRIVWKNDRREASNTKLARWSSSWLGNRCLASIPVLQQFLLGVAALLVLVNLHTLHQDATALLSSEEVSSSSSCSLANNTTAATRPQQPPNRTISLIVKLRGELGNQLSVLANARVTQHLGLAAGLHIELIGQHQEHPKWTRGRDDLVKCFPEFRTLNFEGGVHDEANNFGRVQKLQEAWLSAEEQQKLFNVRDFTFLKQLLDQQAAGEAPVLTNTRYSFPYLTATSFSFWDVVQREDLYHDMRHWMRFDEAACCQQVPAPDEIVFHHRNYLAELGEQRVRGNHFAEVTPETAARSVFGNSSSSSTNHSSRVAIVSRTTAGLESYVTALQQAGLKVRLITGQTGVQDFCFIQKAQREFVGQYQSTFARWAALLGNATVNRFYKLHNSYRRPNATQNHLRVVGERSFVVEEYWQPDKQG